jgi:hypothetical protein
LANARPSVTKKQREQVKRERRLLKEQKRAQRKLAGHQEQPVEPDGFEQA